MTETASNGPDLVAIIALIVSVLAVITAWLRSGKANEIAANSGNTAKSALNEAKRANRTAEEANNTAERSAGAAETAAAEAKRSADIAERVEARQTERSHVSWDVFNAKEIGTWRADNVGTDVAHDAYVALSVNGEWRYSERRDVKPDEAIEFNFWDEYREEEEALQATRRKMASAGVFYGASVKMKIKYEIVWRTENGTWKRQTSEDKKNA